MSSNTVSESEIDDGLDWGYSRRMASNQNSTGREFCQGPAGDPIQYGCGGSIPDARDVPRSPISEESLGHTRFRPRLG